MIKDASAPDKHNLQVVTKDNQTYTGIAPLPKITTKNGENIEINSTDIAYIPAWHNEQSQKNACQFIYTSYKEYKSNKADDGNLDTKTMNSSRWMARVIKNSNISLYFEHHTYYLNNKGEITGETARAGMTPSTWYYAMRDGEDMPTKIAYASNDVIKGNNFLKAWGQKYFRNCPKLVEQIKDEKLKTNNIAEVLNFYSKNCK